MQSLRLFLDSIPKDIGNASGHKSFAANIHFSRRLCEDAERKLSRIQNRRALWIQGRILIIQGTVSPLDLDTCPAKDQARSTLSFTKRLHGQMRVVVNENCDPNLLLQRMRGLSLWLLTCVGVRSKHQTLQARPQKQWEDPADFGFSAHGVFLLAA